MGKRKRQEIAPGVTAQDAIASILEYHNISLSVFARLLDVPSSTAQKWYYSNTQGCTAPVLTLIRILYHNKNLLPVYPNYTKLARKPALTYKTGRKRLTEKAKLRMSQARYRYLKRNGINIVDKDRAKEILKKKD